MLLIVVIIIVWLTSAYICVYINDTETVFEATYPEEEIEESKQVVGLCSESMPGNILSRDAAQLSAYIGSPLSNPHYCPPDRVSALTADTIKHFKAQQFFGNNCVISAAGIDHDVLVKLVEKKFSSLPATSPLYVPRRPSVYTGGMHTNERELNVPFSRVCIAYEVGGWSDKDLVPLCVLQTLLGGGSSFSAGKP